MMARQSSSPKRKRASLPVDATQQQPIDGNEADVEGNQRPKKRGRPKKSLETEEDTQSKPVKSRKRGRPSLGEGAASAHAQDKSKRKRGRPSSGEQQDQAADGDKSSGKEGRDVAVEEDPVRANRGPQRQRRNKTATAPTNEEDGLQEPSGAGRRKRPRVSFEQQLDEQEEEAPNKRHRGRPSLGEANSPGRKSKPKAGGGRQPVAKKALEERSGEQVSESEETSRRQRSSQIALLAADAPPKTKSLPHIISRTRGVKQSTIDAKWSPLDAPSINAATETLTLAHRPIMQRMSNSQARRQHTSSALSVLHRRISRKLQRGLPFPPPNAAPSMQKGRRKVGHEAELDFECVLDGTAALERQLDPALHAVELLKREKERMEKELERDYDTLRNLEAGARGEGRQRRERLRKMHVLAPEKRTEKDEDDLVVGKGTGATPGMAFKDIEDGELKELALQLGGHVDSIKANLHQAEGLLPQLSSSNASLRSLLSRHLDAEQYSRIVYG